MLLRMIRDQVCPQCGTAIVAESSRHTHCNGQGFEEREFACGCRLGWMPNMGRLETITCCPHDPNETSRRERRQKAIEAVLKTIREADVDSDWKRRTESYLAERHSLTEHSNV